MAVISRGNFCEVRRDGATAVKVAVNPIGERMLAAEAAAARRLAGIDGVLQPLAYECRPAPRLLLPWIDGGSLREMLDRAAGAGDRARALRAWIGLVHTMAEVHRRGLIHGDLKPENVLLGEDGRPLLTDFGLARERQRRRRDQSLSHSMRSEPGLVGGTLAYLSPEQVKGAAPSMAGDVYALGVMLHEVLLGRRPDKAKGAEELGSLLPDQVIDVLLHALAYDPRDRCPTAAALCRSLHQLDLLAVTGPARWLRTAGRFVRAALAAFFITLRYAAVVLLCAGYAAIPIASLFNLGWLLMLVPILLIHLTVRWEGPESPEEAGLRRAGGVVAQFNQLA